jgi:hypothetical protein
MEAASQPSHKAAAYTLSMLERVSVRMAPIANRAAEYGPAAPACCNVCRTCTTTNVVGLVVGGMTAAGVWLASVARRDLPKPS